MITSKDIRDSLKSLVERATGLKVSFDFIPDLGEDYAYIRLKPARRDLGFGYIQRRLQVTISIYLAPDMAVVYHTDLLDLADELDKNTIHAVKVLDRFIPIYDTEISIFDNILNYGFELDFTDYVEGANLTPENEYELMKELEIRSM